MPDTALPPQTRFRKRRASDERGCCVYFLAGGGLIKIGISTNLTSRIRAIRNSSPTELELLGTLPGGSATEGLLHMRFGEHRQHGEWFADVPAIRDYLASMIAQKRADGPE